MTVINLDIPFNISNFDDNDLFYAGIYISSPQEESSKWKTRFSGSLFRYSVYQIHQKKWKSSVERIQKLMQTYNKNVIYSWKQSSKIESELEVVFGLPTASRAVTYMRHQQNHRNYDSLEVTQLTRRWRKEHLKHGKIETRAILVITEVKNSNFLYKLGESESSQCIEPSQVQLVMVTLQCLASRMSEATNEPLNVLQHQQKSALIANKKAPRRFPSLQTLNNIQHRSARSTRSTICQRRPMMVDFADLGWSDWVIAPRAFQAYSCVGECPYPLGGRMNSTNYAMLVSMMSSMQAGDSPTPCCVPTSLRPVALLYLDNSDNLVLRNYEGMVVNGCGCR